MTPKEALERIKALFTDAAPVVHTEDTAATVAMEAKEYVLEGGTKVLISDLEIGGMVSIMAEDGSSTPAPAGDHKLADGTTITVDESGVITSISNPNPVPEEPSAEEDMKSKIAQLEAQAEELKANIASSKLEFMAAIKDAENKVKEVADIVVKLMDIPSADPVQPVKNNFDAHVNVTREQKISNFLEFAKNYKNK